MFLIHCSATIGTPKNRIQVFFHLLIIQLLMNITSKVTQKQVRNFLREEVPTLISELDTNTPTKWGLMKPQHMIEHLSGVVYISRKEANLPIITPEEKLERYRQFLWDDRPFIKFANAPHLKQGELPNLRFPSLEEAKAVLIKNINAFYEFYEANPEATFIHPVYGMLNKEAWERFHYKHFIHHFKQFGLIDES